MPTPARISARVLFLLATAFGVSSAAQSYWLQRLNGDPVVAGGMARLVVLNLVYWYVPALLAPAIMRLALRFPLSRYRWPVQAGIHLAGVLAYSIVHTGVMTLARVALWAMLGRPESPVAFWQAAGRDYLMQLDWLVMTYLFLVGLAHAVAYHRESEVRAVDAARLETRLVEARLQALQHQIQPHFLFNTLNAISGLVHSRPEAADRMIAGLGGLLRTALHASGLQEVPLERELEVLEQYLDIEQIRLGGRLQVSMRVDPDARAGLVPNLLLQPLVENAVRHGIAPHARPGRVEVRAARDGNELRIEVRDSGDGVPAKCLSAMNDGVGLANTRARLDHLYPSAHQCVFSNLDDGFAVAVRIPFRPAGAGPMAARDVA